MRRCSTHKGAFIINDFLRNPHFRSLLWIQKGYLFLSSGFKMSYNPALERCVYLIKNEIEASRRFYLYLDKMLSLHDTIKFMMAILVNLKKQAQHQLQNFNEEMGDNEEDDKENQKGIFF